MYIQVHKTAQIKMQTIACIMSNGLRFIPYRKLNGMYVDIIDAKRLKRDSLQLYQTMQIITTANGRRAFCIPELQLSMK